MAPIPDLFIQAERPEDHARLGIGLSNLALDASGKRIVLGPIATAPSTITLTFQPQHLLEEALSPDQAAQSSLPVVFQASAQSSLTFVVPRSFTGCDFTLAALLQLCSQLELSPETSIVLPSSLRLSPDPPAAWAHAARADHSARTGHTALWHTRLGVRGPSGVDESQRPPLRADAVTPAPTLPAPHYSYPNTADVEGIATNSRTIAPIVARRLMLSALGGWLDAEGDWPTASQNPKLWQQRITLGRDQYVKTVDTGYLAPFGHPAVLTRITQRSLEKHTYYPAAQLIVEASLYIPQPIADYEFGNVDHPMPTWRQLPFKSIEILQVESAVDPQSPLWLTLNGNELWLPFVGTDQRGRRIKFTSKAMFVPQGAKASVPDVTVSLGGQRLAFAPADESGVPGTNADGTTFETSDLTISTQWPDGSTQWPDGAPVLFPYVSKATIAVEALRHVAGVSTPVPVTYHTAYTQNGFPQHGDTNHPNQGEVLFQLGSAVQAAFSQQSDRAGGFVSPDMSITGLSRSVGTVGGNLDALAMGSFNPADLLQGAKLFGTFNLVDLLASQLPLGDAPKFITQSFNTFEQMVSLAKSLPAQIDDLRSRVDAAATNVLNALTAVEQAVGPLPDDVSKLLQDIAAWQPPAPLPAQLSTDLSTLKGHLDSLASALDTLVTALSKDAAVASGPGLLLQRQLAAIQDAVKTGRDKFAGGVDAMAQLLDGWRRGYELAKNLAVKLDWKPALTPRGALNDLFYFNPRKPLLLSVEVRAKADGARPPGADVLCVLEDFDLMMAYDEHAKDAVVTLTFKKLAFHVEAGKKPDVDVVFDKLHFGRSLSFLQTLQDLIPLDGFSDPPSLSVTPQGISADYSMAIPNVAIGVFSLDDMKVAASLSIPFIGPPPQFEFDFCTRDHPFHLTVYIFGGGGWFGLKLGTKEIDVEAGLEFGAAFSADFGVASGSVSAMAGVYFQLQLSETQTGANDLTIDGYFHLHGQIEVLDLISVSLDLRMDLSYESNSGKVLGRATLTIDVDIAFFSTSVSISVEKRFAGHNADPTFKEMIDQPAWSAYLDAFAPPGPVSNIPRPPPVLPGGPGLKSHIPVDRGDMTP
jgi:hypothetical protein